MTDIPKLSFRRRDGTHLVPLIDGKDPGLNTGWTISHRPGDIPRLTLEMVIYGDQPDLSEFEVEAKVEYRARIGGVSLAYGLVPRVGPEGVAATIPDALRALAAAIERVDEAAKAEIEQTFRSGIRVGDRRAIEDRGRQIDTE